MANDNDTKYDKAKLEAYLQTLGAGPVMAGQQAAGIAGQTSTTLADASYPVYQGPITLSTFVMPLYQGEQASTFTYGMSEEVVKQIVAETVRNLDYTQLAKKVIETLKESGLVIVIADNRPVEETEERTI